VVSFRLWRLRRICRFGGSSEHPVRSRNTIWILNGVVGYVFGIVLAVLVLRWFPNVVRGLWFVDIVLNIFSGYPSLQVLRAEALVERLTARFTCVCFTCDFWS
jgi:hypothetical protein